MYGCQQILIHANKDIFSILEYLCSESNKIYNCAVYYARQVYFKTRSIVTRSEICAEMVQNRHFKAMYVSSSQQTCNAVAEAFKSFKQLVKAFEVGKIEQIPSAPSYRKSGGLYTVAFPIRWLKLTKEGIRIPLGKQVKAWFGIDCFHLPMPSNLDWQLLKEVRIIPRNGCFYAEFVYSKVVEALTLDKSQALGIDPGLNNWLTCVDTRGNSFIVDGRHLKSVNQWYNKYVASLKEGKPQGFWSKRLAATTEKRNRSLRDAINKAARIVVNHCLENSIGRIVFGWNQGIKQEVKLGKKRNQEFVQIPTARLKARISQLCLQYQIEFIETEESYTSQASFLDNDSLPTYGAKPQEWKSSGKRVHRGLFRTARNWYVNADVNGAANILKKVGATLGLCLEGVSRGALTTPLKVRFWTT